MRLKRVLVIGGTGFLGQSLVSELQRRPGLEVNISSRNSSRALAIHLDILDQTQVQKILPQFDLAINLTGQISSPINSCFQQNTIGISNLIQTCQNSSTRLVQFSSTLVYGTAAVVDEDTSLNPESAYATCKAMAEFLIKERLPSQKYLIIRLSNLYGPHQNHGLLWKLIDCLKNQTTLDINDNDGSLSRHFIHVDEAAKLAGDLILSSAREVFNLTGPDKYSIKELVTLINKISAQKITATYAKIKPSSNINIIKTEKIAKQITLAYRYRLADYLKSAIAIATKS